MGRNWLTKSYPYGTLLNINGIDGCKGGWLVAKTKFCPHSGTHQDHQVEIVENWRKAVQKADLIAVDMPIGLTTFGKRTCDVLARKKLGKKKSSSVFSPPRRGMLQFETYAQANCFGKEQGPRETYGGGLSKQAWNITPKIKEIDGWITPRRQSRVFETHPELVYAALNGGTPLSSKKTEDGQRDRIRLLKDNGMAAFTNKLETLPSRMAAPDDILDAAVLCLAGARIVLGQATCLTDNAQKDETGLKMEIWF